MNINRKVDMSNSLAAYYKLIMLLVQLGVPIKSTTLIQDEYYVRRVVYVMKDQGND